MQECKPAEDVARPENDDFMPVYEATLTKGWLEAEYEWPERRPAEQGWWRYRYHADFGQYNSEIDWCYANSVDVILADIKRRGLQRIEDICSCMNPCPCMSCRALN